MGNLFTLADALVILLLFVYSLTILLALGTGSYVAPGILEKILVLPMEGINLI